MPDSVSATISVSPQAAIMRYITQAIFLFGMAGFAAVALINRWEPANLWIMVLVLSIAHMLNLPIIDIVQLAQQNLETPSETSPA